MEFEDKPGRYQVSRDSVYCRACYRNEVSAKARQIWSMTAFHIFSSTEGAYASRPPPTTSVLISVAIPTRVDGPRALTLTSRTLCLFSQRNDSLVPLRPEAQSEEHSDALQAR